MRRIHLWCERHLNLEQSARTNTACYDLGTLRAGITIRIPVRLGKWLMQRVKAREDKRELQEELAVQALQLERDWPERVA